MKRSTCASTKNFMSLCKDKKGNVFYVSRRGKRVGCGKPGNKKFKVKGHKLTRSGQRAVRSLKPGHCITGGKRISKKHISMKKQYLSQLPATTINKKYRSMGGKKAKTKASKINFIARGQILYGKTH